MLAFLHNSIWFIDPRLINRSSGAYVYYDAPNIFLYYSLLANSRDPFKKPEIPASALFTIAAATSEDQEREKPKHEIEFFELINTPVPTHHTGRTFLIINYRKWELIYHIIADLPSRKANICILIKIVNLWSDIVNSLFYRKKKCHSSRNNLWLKEAIKTLWKMLETLNRKKR